ncbi:ECF-type sigma factor [Ahniella affigens]|nr:ECF-type sigma factor [Ahniella affigens]
MTVTFAMGILTDSSSDLTQLLARWRRGDREAEADLVQAMYPMFRDMARRRLQRIGGHLTLRATELVHEAYERITQADWPEWESRAHFVGVVAKVIRNLVIDTVREQQSEKRGGQVQVLSWSELEQEPERFGSALEIDLGLDWIGLDRALAALERESPEAARLVELKFFAGLNTDELADALGVSRASVVREWRFARAFLSEQLQAPDSDAG